MGDHGTVNEVVKVDPMWNHPDTGRNPKTSRLEGEERSYRFMWFMRALTEMKQRQIEPHQKEQPHLTDLLQKVTETSKKIGNSAALSKEFYSLDQQGQMKIVHELSQATKIKYDEA